jgi:transcriptional regulator with XRE-family HTH domain
MDAGDDIRRQLRDAIADSGRSLNQLSRDAGVSDSQLSRFMRGERTLTLETAAALCRALGLHLAPVAGAEPPPAKKGRKRKGSTSP